MRTAMHRPCRPKVHLSRERGQARGLVMLPVIYALGEYSQEDVRTILKLMDRLNACEFVLVGDDD